MDGATVRVPVGTLIYRIRQTAVWTKHYNHVKLPTQCIYVFCLDLGKTGYYFPVLHQLTGSYNRDLTLYSPVVAICTKSLTFNNLIFMDPCIVV